MIVLLALACTSDPDYGPGSPAVWVEDLAPVTVVPLGAAGAGPVDVWVRARNGVGGSVLGGRQFVEVDGVPREVDIGPQGYASLPIEGVGTHEIRTASGSATAHVYGVDWSGFALQQGFVAPSAPTDEAIASGRGVLTSVGNEVWWTGLDGRSHVVLTTDTSVDGITAGQLDGDGVTDAAVWAGRAVYLLRGRAAGGMIYAGQLRAAQHDAVGVAIGDASGDGLSDLVITWVGGPLVGRLDIWEGDGLLGYTSIANRVLEYRPFGVGIGDNLADGTPDITLTRFDGNWARFYRAPDPYYAPMGPNLILELPAAARVYTPRAFRGDADALLVAGPWGASTQREIRLFDLNREPVTVANLDRVGARVAVSDLDGNGRDEVLVHTAEGALLGVSGAGGALSTFGLVQTGGPGAVAHPEGVDRLLVAGAPDWMWFDLDLAGPDPAVVEPELISPGISVRDGLFELAELDGDPSTVEVIAVRNGPFTRLRIWSVSSAGVVDRGEHELDPEEVPLLDLARCGDQVWALLPGALYRVSVADPDAPARLGSVEISGRRIACGAGPAGPIAVLQDASIALLNGSLVQVGASPSAGSENLWLDASGTRTCARLGCDLVRAPVGAGGSAVDVVSWPTGAEVDAVGVRGSGSAAVGDVDGNGFPDVVLVDAGRVIAHRHTGDSLGPPEVFHTRRPIGGPARLADYDGDGRLDVWALEPESGRIRIVPQAASSPSPPPPPDTGDTGG